MAVVHLSVRHVTGKNKKVHIVTHRCVTFDIFSTIDSKDVLNCGVHYTMYGTCHYTISLGNVCVCVVYVLYERDPRTPFPWQH